VSTEATDDAPESGKNGVGWLAMGIVLALVWLAVRGVSLTPVRLAEEGLIGLGLGLPLAYVVRQFYRPVTGLDASLRPLPYAALYAVTFVWELVTANVDVALRVVAPSMPIDPAVVEVPLRVESDLAVTTLANSVTLTPGTLTMDYDPATNALYVHSIDGTDRDAVVEPIRRWEDYLLVVFEERLKPGDPVPARPTTDGGATPDDTAGRDDPDLAGGEHGG
jgi:multicomponent Na+:H+ antiporter subunit E